MNKKQKIIVILIIVTIIQIGIRIYVGNEKTYFHMDEAYSYGLMNYHQLNITDNEDFLNKWHTRDYYLDYLEINQEETWNWRPVYENQKNDVHPPLYYLLLRIMCTFTIDTFTKWTGLILNIIIFAISNIFIYKITEKLFKSSIFAVLACIINGFSLISINSGHYIRMYELANLTTLGLTWFHLKIWDKETIRIKDLLPISISFIIGGMTHYYILLYGIGLYIIFTIKYIKHKSFNNFKKYQICIFGTAILYLAIFPFAIQHVFFSYRGVSQTDNTNILLQIFGYLQVINQEFFNSLCIIFIAFLWIFYKRPKQREETHKVNKSSYLLWIPCLLYLLIVIPKAPYIEARYVMPIYSVIIISILYGMKNIFIQGRQVKETFLILVFMYSILLYSPIVTKSKMDFTYTQNQDVVQEIEKENQPIVYLFEANHNRFLDDIYLFTLVDKSAVVERNNIMSFLYENQECILICQEKDIKELGIEENCKWLQNMNACQIYQVSFTHE